METSVLNQPSEGTRAPPTAGPAPNVTSLTGLSLFEWPHTLHFRPFPETGTSPPSEEFGSLFACTTPEKTSKPRTPKKTFRKFIKPSLSNSLLQTGGVLPVSILLSNKSNQPVFQPPERFFLAAFFAARAFSCFSCRLTRSSIL